MNAFDSAARKFYHREKYTACTKLPLLTYLTKNDNIATLHIDGDAALFYTKNQISCCYSNITRKENKHAPDDDIR